jgi:hypothetical protein
MRKIAKLSLGVFAFTTLALSAMPSGKASAQTAALKERVVCTLEACVESAQQQYACCKDPGAEGCYASYVEQPVRPTRTCAQELVLEIGECPGQVLECKLDQLGAPLGK